VARDHGIACSDPVVLEDTSNTLVWLRPAPIVARVPALTARVRPDGGEGHLRREVSVAGHLAAAGAPVLGPTPEMPPGPHERDGRWMTFWPYVDHDEGRAVSVEEAAALLRQVHDALAGYPGELALLAPVLEEVPRIVGHLERGGRLQVADAEALIGYWARLAPQLEALAGDRPLHGDAHVGNMLVPHGGGPLWSDFEDTCRGHLAWDLACLRSHSSAFGDRALEAYGAEAGEAELELCMEARDLQVTVWTCLAAQQRPELAERAAARLAFYRAAR
jgi:aminoglycoside phosphotransferase (APT) family kinase protein